MSHRFSRKAASTLLLVISTISCQQVFADSYQNEFSASHASSTGSSDTKVSLLAIQHYLTAVDTRDQPLAEAAFLQRASYIGAAIGQSGYDNGYGFEPDGPVYALAGHYQLPGKDLFIGAEYTETDLAESYEGSKDEITYQQGSLYVGYYLNNSTSLSLGYDNALTNIRSDWYRDTDKYSSRTHVLTLSGKRVQTLGNGQSLNLESSLSHYRNDSDTEDQLSVGGDFYLNRMTSVGVGLERMFTAETTRTEIRVNHFFEDNMGLEASTYKILNSYDSEKGWDLTLKVRF
jgi:hypothetical protein